MYLIWPNSAVKLFLSFVVPTGIFTADVDVNLNNPVMSWLPVSVSKDWVLSYVRLAWSTNSPSTPAKMILPSVNELSFKPANLLSVPDVSILAA